MLGFFGLITHLPKAAMISFPFITRPCGYVCVGIAPFRSASVRTMPLFNVLPFQPLLQGPVIGFAAAEQRDGLHGHHPFDVIER